MLQDDVFVSIARDWAIAEDYTDYSKPEHDPMARCPEDDSDEEDAGYDDEEAVREYRPPFRARLQAWE